MLVGRTVWTKSNVKLGGFRLQLQSSNVSSHTEVLWYKETVCLWMTIYIYIYRERERDRQTDIQRVVHPLSLKTRMILLSIRWLFCLIGYVLGWHDRSSYLPLLCFWSRQINLLSESPVHEWRDEINQLRK